MKHVIFLIAISTAFILLVSTRKTEAQFGILDTSFADNGLYIYEVSGFQTTNVTGIEAQGDGTYIICGKAASRVPNVSSFLAIKLNYDGSMDEGFGTDGFSLQSLYYRAFTHDLGLDAAEKILLTGQDFDGSVNLENIGIMRLNADGSPDLTFGDSGRVSLDYGSHEEGHAILQQPDGKVLISGHTNYDAPSGTFGANANFFVARLLANGQLDTSFAYSGFFTFGVNGTSSDFSKDMILKPDGKIICVGTSAEGGTRKSTLIQLNQNGTLDYSFGNGGVVKYLIGTDAIYWHVVRQQDGKLVCVGQALFVGANYDFIVGRYNEDGSIDSTFGNNGGLSYDLGGDDEKFEGVEVQNNGKIVCAGYTHSDSLGNPVVFRFNEDGTMDNSFGTNGIFILNSQIGFDETKGCAIDPSGNILVAGILHDFSGSNDKAFVFRLKSGCSANYSVVASGPTTLCKGENVGLIVTPAASSYQWKKNGNNIDGATSVNYSTKAAGDYTCTISGLCGTITTNAISVLVNPKPKAVIKPTGTVQICQGDSAQLKANNTPGLTYQWFRSSALITGATNPFYWAKQEGKYHVETTDANGCSSQSSKTTVEINCKIVSENGIEEFVVYPNPASSKIFLRPAAEFVDEIAIRIFDVAGKLAESKKVAASNEEIEIDVSALMPGLYFLEIESGGIIHRSPIAIGR